MKGFAERLGKTVYIPGNAISAEDVRDADALIIRTRTRCDRNLLEHSKVRFIATATIGFDHLDTEYLKQKGISWTNCPGCNAASVAQYVESALLLLAAHGCWNRKGCMTDVLQDINPDMLDRKVFSELTLGIVGVGHVGSQIAKMARRLGFSRILFSDPVREEKEKFGIAIHPSLEKIDYYVSLADLAAQSDVVTFHTPLTYALQTHPTFHLADARFFEALKPGAVLFNSSRGEVVDTQALLDALDKGRLRTAVIDTWENEPHISTDLLDKVFLGTPHIAGYSADGKVNGTRMSLQAVARHFSIDDTPFLQIAPPALPDNYAYYPQMPGHASIPELRNYDPARDYAALKTNPALFETLRGDYPLRREYHL